MAGASGCARYLYEVSGIYLKNPASAGFFMDVKEQKKWL